jgi:hypothetical protein
MACSMSEKQIPFPQRFCRKSQSVLIRSCMCALGKARACSEQGSPTGHGCCPCSGDLGRTPALEMAKWSEHLVMIKLAMQAWSHQLRDEAAAVPLAARGKRTCQFPRCCAGLPDGESRTLGTSSVNH